MVEYGASSFQRTVQYPAWWGRRNSSGCCHSGAGQERGRGGQCSLKTFTGLSCLYPTFAAHPPQHLWVQTPFVYVFSREIVCSLLPCLGGVTLCYPWFCVLLSADPTWPCCLSPTAVSPTLWGARCLQGQGRTRQGRMRLGWLLLHPLPPWVPGGAAPLCYLVNGCSSVCLLSAKDFGRSLVLFSLLPFSLSFLSLDCYQSGFGGGKKERCVGSICHAVPVL